MASTWSPLPKLTGLVLDPRDVILALEPAGRDEDCNVMIDRADEKRLRWHRTIWLGVLAACLACGGCSGGQNVTAPNIKAARELWAKAGIRDYDLEYTTAPANGHYFVTVATAK